LALSVHGSLVSILYELLLCRNNMLPLRRQHVEFGHWEILHCGQFPAVFDNRNPRSTSVSGINRSGPPLPTIPSKRRLGLTWSAFLFDQAVFILTLGLNRSLGAGQGHVRMISLPASHQRALQSLSAMVLGGNQMVRGLVCKVGLYMLESDCTILYKSTRAFWFSMSC